MEPRLRLIELEVEDENLFAGNLHKSGLDRPLEVKAVVAALAPRLPKPGEDR